MHAGVTLLLNLPITARVFPAYGIEKRLKQTHVFLVNG